MTREPFDFDKKRGLGLAGKVKKKFEEEHTEVEELGGESIVKYLEGEVEKIFNTEIEEKILENDRGKRYTITWPGNANGTIFNSMIVTILSDHMTCTLDLYTPNPKKPGVFFRQSPRIMLHGNPSLPISSDGANVILYMLKKVMKISESSTNLGLARKVNKKFDKETVQHKAEEIGLVFQDPYLVERLEERGITTISDCQKLKELGNLISGFHVQAFFEDCQMKRFPEFKYFTGIDRIPERCFSNCENLKEIELPSSIKEIRANAFYGCKSLRRIVIPEGVEQIQKFAFNDCPNLKEIWIPDSMKYLPNHVYMIFDSYVNAYRDKFKDIRLYVRKTSKVSIDLYLWKYGVVWCDKDWNPIQEPITESALGLNRKVLQKHLADRSEDKKIDAVSLIHFEDPVIEEVMHANYIYSYDDAREADDILFKKIIVDARRLENDRFGDVKTFNEFKYFTSVTDIPDEAFYNLTMLESIELPESLTYVGELAFKNCYNLCEISIPDNVEEIGSEAFGHSGISYIFFSPNSKLKRIGSRCFGYSRLHKIELPSNGNLDQIGYEAFIGCLDLEYVNIPNSVTVFGDSDFDVFLYCTSLNNIDYTHLQPQIIDNVNGCIDRMKRDR